MMIETSVDYKDNGQSVFTHRIIEPFEKKYFVRIEKISHHLLYEAVMKELLELLNLKHVDYDLCYRYEIYTFGNWRACIYKIFRKIDELVDWFLCKMWELGLVDTANNEVFRWSDFFRIKSH